MRLIATLAWLVAPILLVSAADENIDSLIGSVFIPNGQQQNNQQNYPSKQQQNPGGLEDLINQSEFAPKQEIENHNVGPVDGECKCVPFYLCANNTIITDGAGLLDIRIKADQCDNYMDVCCRDPLPPSEAIRPKPHGRLGCGKRNVDGVGFRITGNLDNEAQFGEFPWMVAILREEILDGGNKLFVYQCGGALIHQNVILTAAHCVINKDVSLLKVRAGEWDTQTKDELLQHQDRDISKIVTHEKYYAGALYNDVALLFTKEPFEFADNIDIVCLPNQNDVVISNECFASGWGKDVFGKEGRYQVILKKIDLPIVPRPKCLEELRKTRLGPYFRLHESFICAGGVPGKDTCKGDGGSPLVCPIPGRDYQYIQVGIVAWGIGCGNETPAAYANVAGFREWIDNQLTQHNLNWEYNY